MIPRADVLHVRFGPEHAAYDASQEVAPGVFVEFDAAGVPIGVEVLSVRARMQRVQEARSAAE